MMEQLQTQPAAAGVGEPLPKAPPTVTSLQELLRQLHIVFSRDNISVDYVERLLAGYVSRADDWKQYAKWDKFKYTRNLVDAGNGKFDVMILCWPESIASTIHDHTDSHCFMKVLQGELTEIRFAWPDDDTEEKGMCELGRTRLPNNGVCYINDSLGLHRVENASHSERAVSLHVYVPPFSTCQAFDQRTGRRQTCRVTFWSKYGRRIQYQPSMDQSCGSGMTAGESQQPQQPGADLPRPETRPQSRTVERARFRPPLLPSHQSIQE